MKPRPKRSKKEKKNRGGRPPIPPDLVRVQFSCRVPQRILTGFESRARKQGTGPTGQPNSSVGLEVERAFQATEPPP